MTDPPPPTPIRPGADPRVRVVKRVVLVVGVFALTSVSVATVFATYHCATERPAREMFLPPLATDAGPGPEAPLPR